MACCSISGFSSMQLDQPERGFSYSQDAPLDMRMDTEAELTAAEIINSFDRRELTDILRRFGEERFAHRIAGLIVEQRSRAPFSTTAELVELIYRAIPAPARRTGASRQTDVPGAPHSGQCGARFAGGRSARGFGCHPCGWAS